MGKGGSAGTGSRTGRGISLAQAQRAIAKIGGIFKGQYLREGFRGMDHVNAAFRGATPSQATAIATGKRDVMGKEYGGGRLPPVTAYVQRDMKGRMEIHLGDGRHRSTAAKAAGATHIRANVKTEYQNKRGKWVEGKTYREVMIKL